MSSPAWPTFYGTMLLIAMDAPLSELEDLERELNAALKPHDAAFARGLEAVPVDVRPGLLARTWLEPARVFVLRCPSGRPENQACIAAIAKGDRDYLDLQSAAVRVIEDATFLALARSARVAWVVADEWHVDDAVAFQMGHFGEFVEYARSTFAWTTPKLARGKSYIVTSNNELPFWYEVRSSTKTPLGSALRHVSIV